MVDRKLHGTGAYHGKGHIIIFGYHADRTEEVVAEIFANTPGAALVLVDEAQEQNPFPVTEVEFISGRMSSSRTLERANARHAANIIVDGAHDDETFFTAYGVRKVNTHARLVCHLKDPEHADKIKKDLPADDPALNQVILPVNLYLMAQELQDPESCQVFQHLFSNQKGATHYRLDIPASLPESITFGDIFTHLKLQYDAIVIALKDTRIRSNPKMGDAVRAGDAIFYIADQRLTQVDWSAITAQAAA